MYVLLNMCFVLDMVSLESLDILAIALDVCSFHRVVKVGMPVNARMF